MKTDRFSFVSDMDNDDGDAVGSALEVVIEKRGLLWDIIPIL